MQTSQSGIVLEYPPSGAFPRTRARLHADTPSGEVVWRWIALAFAGYWTLFVAGAYTGRQELNNVGAVLILAALGWATLERLWVKVDAVAAACLVAAAIPLLVMFASNAPRHPDALVKHLSLYLVMAVSRILRLPVASSSRMRWVLAGQVLIILLISVTIDVGGVWDGGTRHSGLFANPNNLALIPFLLLFFIDWRRDPLALQVAAHCVVIAVLAWSGTSGALIAYAIGLAVHYGALLQKHWRTLALTLVFLGGFTIVGFVALGGGEIIPETRLTNQISVMGSQLGTVLSGGNVAYWEQEKILGPGAASGIWRLVHWRLTVVTYASGTLAQMLVGFGIGSSPGYLGKLPHNEYLRILFEQGITGLLLFLFAWGRIIRSAPREVRYCGLILAIYSFSENNLDNFPFMSLFILCLSAITPVSPLSRRGIVGGPSVETI